MSKVVTAPQLPTKFLGNRKESNATFATCRAQAALQKANIEAARLESPPLFRPPARPPSPILPPQCARIRFSLPLSCLFVLPKMYIQM